MTPPLATVPVIAPTSSRMAVTEAVVVGATVSTVSASAGLTGLTLPAASVSVVVN